MLFNLVVVQILEIAYDYFIIVYEQFITAHKLHPPFGFFKAINCYIFKYILLLPDNLKNIMTYMVNFYLN